jgi:hypothetical protein
MARSFQFLLEGTMTVKRRNVIAVVAFLGLSAVAATAAATWTSQAYVTKVRTLASGDQLDIWFDRNITTGCTFNSRVTVDTSYSTTFRIDEAQKIATSALLSGRNIEINTLTGCANGNGKLDYLSLY